MIGRVDPSPGISILTPGAAEFGTLLEDLAAYAEFPQLDGRANPGDPSADDGDMKVDWRMRRLSQPMGSHAHVRGDNLAIFGRRLLAH